MTIRFGCLASLLVSGCSLAVEVDDFEFRDPGESRCRPAPPGACDEAGERYVFVFASTTLGRVHEDGTADGVDLDGTDETVCAQSDFASPFGDTGVDNQFAPFVAPLEELEGVTFSTLFERHIVQGMHLRIVDIGGVSNLENDPCVSYRIRDGQVPEGVAIEDLDREPPMGVLDPGLTLDYSPAIELDATACIEDGLLRARLPPTSARIVLSVPESEIEVQRSQITARFETDGSILRLVGVRGSSSRAADLDRAFASFTDLERITAVVKPDLDPDEDGVCQSVSFAGTFEGVPVVLGAPF